MTIIASSRESSSDEGGCDTMAVPSSGVCCISMISLLFTSAVIMVEMESRAITSMIVVAATWRIADEVRILYCLLLFMLRFISSSWIPYLGLILIVMVV